MKATAAVTRYQSVQIFEPMWHDGMMCVGQKHLAFCNV